MASLEQMERALIAERTKAGLQAARKAGRIGGHKRSMTPAKIEAARTSWRRARLQGCSGNARGVGADDLSLDSEGSNPLIYGRGILDCFSSQKRSLENPSRRV
jgi:hypothetical protein